MTTNKSVRVNSAKAGGGMKAIWFCCEKYVLEAKTPQGWSQPVGAGDWEECSLAQQS